MFVLQAAAAAAAAVAAAAGEASVESEQERDDEKEEKQEKKNAHVVCSCSEAAIPADFSDAARATTAELLIYRVHDSVDIGFCRLLPLPIVPVETRGRRHQADPTTKSPPLAKQNPTKQQISAMPCTEQVRQIQLANPRVHGHKNYRL